MTSRNNRTLDTSDMDKVIATIHASSSIDYSTKNKLVSIVKGLPSSQKAELMRFVAFGTTAVSVARILSFLFNLGKLPATLLGIGAGVAIHGSFHRDKRNATGQRYLSGVNSFGIRY